MKTGIRLLRVEWFTQTVSIDPAFLSFKLGWEVISCYKALRLAIVVYSDWRRTRVYYELKHDVPLTCHVIEAGAFANVIWYLEILKCELESVTSCCSRLIQAIIQSTIIKVINPSRKNEVSSGCIRHCKNSMSRQQTHVSGIVIVFVWDGAQHYA